MCHAVEEERKLRVAEEKIQAEENERKRLEELKLQSDRRDFRVAEIERLRTEYSKLLDDLKSKELQYIAEESLEVCFIRVFSCYCNLFDVFNNTARKYQLDQVQEPQR